MGDFEKRGLVWRGVLILTVIFSGLVIFGCNSNPVPGSARDGINTEFVKNWTASNFEKKYNENMEIFTSAVVEKCQMLAAANSKDCSQFKERKYFYDFCYGMSEKKEPYCGNMYGEISAEFKNICVAAAREDVSLCDGVLPTYYYINSSEKDAADDALRASLLCKAVITKNAEFCEEIAPKTGPYYFYCKAFIEKDADICREYKGNEFLVAAARFKAYGDLIYAAKTEHGFLGIPGFDCSSLKEDFSEECAAFYIGDLSYCTGLADLELVQVCADYMYYGQAIKQDLYALCGFIHDDGFQVSCFDKIIKAGRAELRFECSELSPDNLIGFKTREYAPEEKEIVLKDLRDSCEKSLNLARMQ